MVHWMTMNTLKENHIKLLIHVKIVLRTDSGYHVPASLHQEKNNDKMLEQDFQEK